MGRGKRQSQLGPRGQLKPFAGDLPQLVYSGQGLGIKVTELDYDKSPEQIALEGGTFTPDNGSSWFGPYADEQEAELDLARAKAYYAKHAREYAAQHGEGELDWRVELLPWPVPSHQRFSDYMAGQYARSQGVEAAEVDLRLVFEEPPEAAPPGPSSRPSALAERAQAPWHA